MTVKDIIDLLALLRDYAEVLKLDFEGNKELVRRYEAQSRYEQAEEYMKEQEKLEEKLRRLSDIAKMLMESEIF